MPYGLEGSQWLSSAIWRGRAARSGSAGRNTRNCRTRHIHCCPATTRFIRHGRFQHAEPGTVLRSRDVELAFLGVIPQSVTAIQLLYRTTNMHGEPEATATTVIVPAERAPGRKTPLLSYQCAIDAMSSALLSVLCAGAEGPRPSVPSPSLSSSWWPLPWPRAGRSRYPTTEAFRAFGARRTSPAIASWTASAPP